MGIEESAIINMTQFSLGKVRTQLTSQVNLRIKQTESTEFLKIIDDVFNNALDDLEHRRRSCLGVPDGVKKESRNGVHR